jgi:hypothetical protein
MHIPLANLGGRPGFFIDWKEEYDKHPQLCWIGSGVFPETIVKSIENARFANHVPRNPIITQSYKNDDGSYTNYYCWKNGKGALFVFTKEAGAYKYCGSKVSKWVYECAGWDVVEVSLILRGGASMILTEYVQLFQVSEIKRHLKESITHHGISMYWNPTAALHLPRVQIGQSKHVYKKKTVTIDDWHHNDYYPILQERKIKCGT